MTDRQRLAYNLFGHRARNSKNLPKLEEALRKAHMPIRSEAYLAYVWFSATLTAIVVTVLAILVMPLAISLLDLPGTMWLMILIIPGSAWFTAYLALIATPASKAKKRAKDIDANLPYAANYIAAMASAGVIPAEIFKSLAKQEIYKDVSKESAMIYKDLEVHGRDIVTALRRAMGRSPSSKFQELLQGAITTITSGGNLTGYFRQKADRYQWENRVEQRTFIETMGLMAETYVTAAVAGPLFLIVMVAIIVLIGSGEISQLQLIIYLLLPVINIGFMLGLKSMIPEV